MYAVLINPTAGAGLARRVGTLVAESLASRGLTFETLTTEHPGHAEVLARQAADRGVKTLFVVGGDGTIFEAARGLSQTGGSLAIIPAGTGNDFVKSLGIPLRPLAALEHALSHAPRAVDAGSINGRLFGNECGTGFDVTVLEYARRFKHLGHGLLPYLLGVLCAIVRSRPIRLTFTLEDGSRLDRHITVCAVANGRFIGGGIPVAPNARVDDGLLDVVILAALPRWKMPFFLPGLLAGRILSFPGVEAFRCRSIAFEGKGLHVNVDGDILQMDRAALEILPGALRVHA